MHPFRKQFYLFCVIKEFLNALFSCFNIRHTHKILTITCVLTSAKEIIYTRIKHRQKKKCHCSPFLPSFLFIFLCCCLFQCKKERSFTAFLLFDFRERISVFSFLAAKANGWGLKSFPSKKKGSNIIAVNELKMERSLIRFLRLFFRFHQFIELYFTKAFIVDGFERKKIQHFALLTWLTSYD